MSRDESRAANYGNECLFPLLLSHRSISTALDVGFSTLKAREEEYTVCALNRVLVNTI